ncbi:hypothetical protein G4B88_023026 [Cannabis sativa]|uniref:Uncharacterized protein n=1 Tax=Cannabis sativa TaxID=3483 RepID=A0A7J6I0U9_CANSA|nr:hypothetical protein G4B88_023026 [Cannabis sativa]
MISSGINRVMTVIGFAVSILFIVFVRTRLICARIHLNASRRSFPIASRSNLSIVALAHSLYPESAELYLIIDDSSKSGLTKNDAMKKIKAEGIALSKVIKLLKLKTDYKAFESKRKLCDSYDMFLAHKRVVTLLSRLLGKQFFKKKKKLKKSGGETKVKANQRNIDPNSHSACPISGLLRFLDAMWENSTKQSVVHQRLKFLRESKESGKANPFAESDLRPRVRASTRGTAF